MFQAKENERSGKLREEFHYEALDFRICVCAYSLIKEEYILLIQADLLLFFASLCNATFLALT